MSASTQQSTEAMTRTAKPRPVLRGPDWPWLVPALVLLLLVVAVTVLLVVTGTRETSERRQQQAADALWLKQTIQHQLDRSIERIAAIAIELGKTRLDADRSEIKLSNLLQLSSEVAAIGVVEGDGRIVLWLNRRERIAPARVSLYATELSGISRRD
ncbi:MAG TPA: hypothetical protein VFR86_01110, partial [Burkholderiaceae bacterium]|nr:hypothetical protein [Burkholderiaceae bacterium]